MWECSYGREPVDGKLVVLRLIRKIWVILLAALAGMAIVAGGYIFSRTFPDQPEQYKASSSYYVVYAENPESGNPESENPYLYINSETWNQWMGEDVFLDFIKKNLSAGKGQEGLDEQSRQLLASIEKAALRESLSASLQSDMFKPVSTVIMATPELANALNVAVQGAFFDFAGYMDSIEEIRLISVSDAEHIARYPRLLHSCILGCVLGIFIVTLGFVLFFSVDESIWVPGTFTYRYGVPMAAALGKKGGLTRDGAENIRYLFRDRLVIGITSSELDEDLENVAGQVRELLPEATLICVPSVLLCPEEAEKLREADGVLLAVRAGVQNGKRIQRVLDFLKLQDCQTVGSILVQADEGLVKAYYFGKKEK